jgi:hypothetical protein
MMYPEAGPPDGFREMLEKLLPGIATHVPDGILEVWFPPGAVAGTMDSIALGAARAYGASCGCRFSYLSERGEGLFSQGPAKRN